MAQTAKSAGTKGGGLGRWLLFGLVVLPVAGLLLPTTVLLVLYMAPTLVAYMIDRTPEKYLALTVGLLNFSGTLPAIFTLWSRGQAYDAAMGIAADPVTWLMAYGAAALGWGINLSLPSVLGGVYAATAAAKMEMLRRRQAALVKAWGEEVAKDSPGESTPPPHPRR